MDSEIDATRWDPFKNGAVENRTRDENKMCWLAGFNKPTRFCLNYISGGKLWHSRHMYCRTKHRCTPLYSKTTLVVPSGENHEEITRLSWGDHEEIEQRGPLAEKGNDEENMRKSRIVAPLRGNHEDLRKSWRHHEEIVRKLWGNRGLNVDEQIVRKIYNLSKSQLTTLGILPEHHRILIRSTVSQYDKCVVRKRCNCTFVLWSCCTLLDSLRFNLLERAYFSPLLPLTWPAIWW